MSRNREALLEDHCVRHYLLGELTADDEAALEARFFDDDECFFSIEAASTELIRDYLAGDLSPQQRQLFEGKCTSSFYWRDRLDSAKHILTALSGDLRGSDLELAGDLLRAKTEDERVVEEAVIEVLLPSLPPQLRTVEVSARTLFLAIDSISMLLHRRLRRISDPSEIVLWCQDDCFRGKHATLIPAEVAKREIAAVAKVSEDLAAHLLRWIRKAAGLNAYLMLGVKSTPLEDGESVRLVASERRLDEDLKSRWRDGARRVQAELDDYALNLR